MKYLEEKYPVGSLKGQKTAGRYIDGYLYDNLKIMAKNIVNDMTFLIFISSSTLEVGTGKSVFAQQIGECWSLELMPQLHNVKLPWNIRNIVFKPRDLIDRAFEVPQYSCVILDEWEDAHYWSELGMTLRRFFRKCRQLNLLIICIIPNFFELPRSYATSRSVCFIDVRFEGEFERGYFRFYNFDSKWKLYTNGKKTHNYFCEKSNFTGRFIDGYTVNERIYREAKHNDMLEEDKPKVISKKEAGKILLPFLRVHFPDISQERWGNAFGISKRTIARWVAEYSNVNGERGEDDTAEGTK